MRTWIFQGNPEVFDIEGYFAASSGLITWTVARYADHQKERSQKVHPYVLRPSAPTRAINMAPRRTYSCHLHRHKRSILL